MLISILGSTVNVKPDSNNTETKMIFKIIGATVVRMMSIFLGEDVLQEGLINYVKKFAFGSAVSDDLWTALAEVAAAHNVLPQNLTLKQIMDSWTTQAGYAKVDVKINYDQKTATLSQV